MSSVARFYVYLLARPNGQVFYVGKGSKRRAFYHEIEARRGCACHKCCVIRKIWSNDGEVQRYIVFTTNDEQEAFAYERDQIAVYGRENLCNHTDGGDGVRNLTAEARAKLSTAIKRRLATGWEMPRPDQAAHERAGMKLRGRKMPREVVEQMRARQTGKKLNCSPEERQRRADNIKRVGKPFKKGLPAYNKGIPRSEETKQKLSTASAQSSGQQYDLLSPSGVSYTTTHLKAFCQEHDLNYDSIFHNLKHNCPYKGWVIAKRARNTGDSP
jgi:hypothetical protein